MHNNGVRGAIVGVCEGEDGVCDGVPGEKLLGACVCL